MLVGDFFLPCLKDAKPESAVEKIIVELAPVAVIEFIPF